MLLFSASPGIAAEGKKSASVLQQPKAKVDHNRNKLLDDLEARLAASPATGEVNVIVTLDGDATRNRVAELSRRVGGFRVGRRIGLIDGFSATVTKAKAKAEAQALARIPGVRGVEENSVMRALNDGAQSSFGVTKARVDAPGLDGEADGSVSTYSRGDLVAAVIDTGIDAGHAIALGGLVRSPSTKLSRTATGFSSTGEPSMSCRTGTTRWRSSDCPAGWRPARSPST